MAKLQTAFNPFSALMDGKELHGRARITLTDVNTGKETVSEDENLVTNAVKDLFAVNYAGSADYTKLLPVKNFFSGCMMFRNNITENQNQYIPPAEYQNNLIAHAGDQAHSSASPYRGNPNGSETVFTNTSAKFVWTWDTNQGNGLINCVCLCPGQLGNIGLLPFTPDGTMYKSYNVPYKVEGQGNTWTAEKAAMHPLNINPAAGTATSVFINATDSTTAEFVEMVCRHDMNKFNINMKPEDFPVLSTRTVQIGTLGVDFTTKKNYYIFDTTNFYGVVVPYDNKTIFAIKIAKSNFTETHFTYESVQPTDAKYLQTTPNIMFLSVPRTPCTDTHFYVYSSNGKFVKLKWDGTQTEFPEGWTVPAKSYNFQMGPVKINDDLMIGENWFYNSGNFYEMAHVTVPDGVNSASTTAWYSPTSNGTICHGFAYENLSQGRSPVVLATSNMMLSTINNLSEEKEKDASKVMKLEYLISAS
jgi:hypothetical protein